MSTLSSFSGPSFASSVLQGRSYTGLEAYCCAVGFAYKAGDVFLRHVGRIGMPEEALEAGLAFGRETYPADVRPLHLLEDTLRMMQTTAGRGSVSYKVVSNQDVPAGRYNDRGPAMDLARGLADQRNEMFLVMEMRGGCASILCKCLPFPNTRPS
jgi:hypothetical protein